MVKGAFDERCKQANKGEISFMKKDGSVPADKRSLRHLRQANAVCRCAAVICLATHYVFQMRVGTTDHQPTTGMSLHRMTYKEDRGVRGGGMDKQDHMVRKQ